MEGTTSTSTSSSAEFSSHQPVVSKNKSRLDLRFAAYATKRAGSLEADDDNLHLRSSSSKAEVNQFWTDFNALANLAKKNVACALSDGESGGGGVAQLKQLEANIEAAQQLLNKSTHFLPAYDLRSAQTV
jgi:hypothetical protein